MPEEIAEAELAQIAQRLQASATQADAAALHPAKPASLGTVPRHPTVMPPLSEPARTFAQSVCHLAPPSATTYRLARRLGMSVSDASHLASFAGWQLAAGTSPFAAELESVVEAAARL